MHYPFSIRNNPKKLCYIIIIVIFQVNKLRERMVKYSALGRTADK